MTVKVSKSKRLEAGVKGGKSAMNQSQLKEKRCSRRSAREMLRKPAYDWFQVLYMTGWENNIFALIGYRAFFT